MVAVAAAYLGCQMPCKQLSKTFGLSEECLLKFIEYVMDLLVEKSEIVIKRPSKEEYTHMAAEFNKFNKR